MPEETNSLGENPSMSQFILAHLNALSVNTPEHVQMAVNLVEIDVNGLSKSLYCRDFTENDKPFHLASMSKQFFAAGLLHLIESSNGEKSIEDFVGDYIPSWPEYASQVKLKHLLNHSSGLQEYTNNAFTYLKNTNNPATILRFIKNRNTLIQAPGRLMLYTNTNYVLIAFLIELIAVKSISRFMQETFFEPLRMNNTFIFGGKGKKPKTITNYYSLPRFKFIPAVPTNNDFMPGDGGIYTTLPDLQKWALFLSGKSVLGDRVSSKMMEAIPLEINVPSTYGYGLHIKNSNVWHSGSWNGATSFCRFYKSDGQKPFVWYVALANSDFFEPSRMVSAMKNAYYAFK
ncbi:MAG: serine hydrolase domain-containing protein [Flavobacteriaceae bacterium]